MSSFINGLGDVFDTVLTNAGGVADVIRAVNKTGTAATLATPGATAAPTVTAPAAAAPAAATMAPGLKYGLIAGAVALGGILLYLLTGRRR